MTLSSGWATVQCERVRTVVRAVRGAITVENNTKEEILEAAEVLLREIFAKNAIPAADMVNMIFTLTPDLDAVFPAVAARQMGITNVPLMCMSEIPVAGALPKCVRVLLQFNTDKTLDEVQHVYLRDAVKLRPDLVK